MENRYSSLVNADGAAEACRQMSHNCAEDIKQVRTGL